MKHKKLIYFISIIIVIILYLFLTPNLFGSYTDFINQHSVFPEYFRNLFYKTGDLFPDFAFNIGSGQNIYNFAYYGFLNPFILFSYLLPFVKMVDYLMFTNIFIIFLTSYLCYKFLRQNKIDKDISIFVSFLFILSGPFIFQLHRHFMFVNYMPFLFLGLMGVNKYFDKNKSALLIISVLLIILTSFYYSIGCILIIVIYAIYKYLSKIDKFNFKDFIITGVKFLFPIIISVLMSSILIIPTFLTLIGGRGSNSFNMNLFIPDFNLDRILYGNYAIGVSAFFIVSLFYIIKNNKKENITLGIITLICLFLPIITYILNGTLYVRTKALIPFLPIVYFIMALFLKYLFNNKINIKHLWIFILLSSLIFYLTGYHKFYYYLDIVSVGIVITIFQYKKNRYIIYIPILLLSIILCIGNNKKENFVSKNLYNELFNKDDYALIEYIQKKDKSFYRINNLKNMDRVMNKVYNINYYQTSLYSSAYNRNYYDFIYQNETLPYRNNLMQVSTEDILFQSLMGVKYVITDYELGNGYTLLKKINDTYLYQNNYALSIGYSNNNYININDYNKLDYPYNMETLMNGIVNNNKTNILIDSNIKKINLEYSIIEKDNLNITNDNLYKIESNKGHLKLKLNNNSNEILIIKFDLINDSKCSDGDLTITINNVKNKLTCKSWIYYNNNHEFKYVLSNNDYLDINFSNGYFEIDNIEFYELNSNNNNFTKFVIDSNLTKGDIIVGNIKVDSDTYFNLSVPYDHGFTVKVNNKKIDYQLSNNAFIGFNIKKGDNHIEILYEAPGKKVGVVLSIIGLILLISNMLMEKYDEKKFRRKTSNN